MSPPGPNSKRENLIVCWGVQNLVAPPSESAPTQWPNCLSNFSVALLTSKGSQGGARMTSLVVLLLPVDMRKRVGGQREIRGDDGSVWPVFKLTNG